MSTAKKPRAPRRRSTKAQAAAKIAEPLPHVPQSAMTRARDWFRRTILRKN